MGLQKLQKMVSTELEVAQKYYQILSVLNDLKLSEGDIQLIAYVAIKGNLSDEGVREEFCKEYSTSNATINNMVYRLKKKHIFQKEGSKIFVNPVLTSLSFKEEVTLLIKLNVEIKL